MLYYIIHAMNIPEDLRHFLMKQHFVIVSTIDSDGNIHSSCKGIVDVELDGKIFLLDLYKARTLKNLKNDSRITLTVVDEHHFKGYAIVGKAEIVDKEKLTADMLHAWNKKVLKRISHRIVKHVTSDTQRKDNPLPETKFPEPEYLIEVDVSKIINLAPMHLKT